MSREIKFRAWDEIEEKYNNDTDIIMTLNGDYCVDKGFAKIFPKLTLEQYTGLKDKNGKEIYEGDIVRAAGDNYEVRQFRTGAWRIGRDDLYVWADSSEVIGNIHENPGLLEERK